MLTLQAATPSDLGMVASQILNSFPGKRVFALHGTMGAGKTTLIKSLCHELGVTDVVLSPTFALINEYRTREGEPVYHFDFYRIKSLSEAYDMGYEEYFYSNHYCFIEWPEKIEQLLPLGFVYIDIRSGDSDQTRTINVR
jgi:tRNA threonylcarbamoyladenosine biosynthesis protein TsaE